VIGRLRHCAIEKADLAFQSLDDSIAQSFNLLMNGVIIVAKPSGWTSHDVVNRMRRILGQRSIGHLGTLDPLATGVLPLVIGNLTRIAQFYTGSEKTYEGVIRFGFATTTYDADGDQVGDPRSAELTLDQLQRLGSEFVGIIEQTPPPFSAKKIHGVPAYKLARKNKDFELKPVQIEIKEFSITSVEGERANFHARVASGTYMRSVAHELGQRLGCGAHLESLRRTAVAEFVIDQAHTLEEIERCCSESTESAPVDDGRGVETHPVESLFIHPRQLLPQFPSVTADEFTVAHIRNGRPVNLPELSVARQVKVFAGQAELLAIASRIAGSLFHPKIVFAADKAPANRDAVGTRRN
jgi:tRNA pseudouridine55 synthase